MKFFKKLAVLCTALTLCFGIGTSLVACGGDKKESSSSSQTLSGYYFKVLKADGTAAKGYRVQLCTADNVNCLSPVAVGDDGMVAYTADPATAWVIHLMEGTKQVSSLDYQITNGSSTIPANYNGGTKDSPIEIKLTK